MTDQGHDKKHQENEEQYLGDSRGRRSNHSKSQQPGDHRDNEEHQRVIKHLLSSRPARRIVSAGFRFVIRFSRRSARPASTCCSSWCWSSQPAELAAARKAALESSASPAAGSWLIVDPLMVKTMRKPICTFTIAPAPNRGHTPNAVHN